MAADVLHGPIIQLLLATSTWDLRSSRLAVQDRTLRLIYFVSQPPALLTAVCDNGERVDLLIVPPDTVGAVADAAMMRAASVTNRVPAQHIVAIVAADQPALRTPVAAPDPPQGHAHPMPFANGPSPTRTTPRMASAGSAYTPRHQVLLDFPPPIDWAAEDLIDGL